MRIAADRTGKDKDYSSLANLGIWAFIYNASTRKTFANYQEYVSKTCHKAVDSLSNRQKEFIELHFFNNMTQKDIAAQQGISFQRVRQIIVNGLHHIRNSAFSPELERYITAHATIIAVWVQRPSDAQIQARLSVKNQERKREPCRRFTRVNTTYRRMSIK